VPFIIPNRPIPRRQAIGLLGGGTFAAIALPGLAADDGIGTVVDIKGPGQVGRPDRLTAMQAGMEVFVGDLAVTGSEGRAHLGLGQKTEIHLGPLSRLLIDRFIAEIGGVIVLDGAVVFDRAETAPKVDIEFQTDFGRIGVRGTKFFIGPSENAYAVFVERGEVAVTGGGVTRTLTAGKGADLRGNDTAPGPVGDWQEARAKAAFDWVLGPR
jgi:ferric-dicitrate binding protein FerR (iron transport regulator)